MICTVINSLESGIQYEKGLNQIKSIAMERGIVHNLNQEWIDLEQKNIRYCTGCDYCANVNPGQCALKDDQKGILKQFLASDVVVLLTSIQFGCCNVQTKNFMDRTEPFYLPYQVKRGKGTMMKCRYNKYPKLIVIGIGEVADTEKNCFKKFIKNSNLGMVCRDTVVKVVSKETELVAQCTTLLKEESIHE